MVKMFTHPVFASLDHPLFAFGGKRVSELIIELRQPSLSLAKERVDKRSDVGGEYSPVTQNQQS